MGADGGSIPDRRDLVRNKAKTETTDKNQLTFTQWFLCALSKRPLQAPIVLDQLGKLYNKQAILEFLLDKSSYGAEGESVCGYVRGMKDLTPLILTPNPRLSPSSSSKGVSDHTTDTNRPLAPFVCPLSLKEMNGSIPFVAIKVCGHVFSEQGLKETAKGSTGSGLPSPPPEDKKEAAVAEVKKSCPECSKAFSWKNELVRINPPAEEQENMRILLLAARAAEPPKLKKDKKRKSGAAEVDSGVIQANDAKRLKSSVAQKVAAELKAQEDARKGQMSAAVASLYAPKDGKQEKEGFMTRTFARYA